jgi:DNA-directed RNA polymerase specialized sigma subunit
MSEKLTFSSFYVIIIMSSNPRGDLSRKYEMKPTKRLKNPDTPEATSKYYLTNSRLLPEVIKSKELGRITNELATMLLMLTRKYASKHWFSGYTYKEDMISEAVANLCQNALKFNPELSSNPFAFYTSCINNSFLQVLNNEKKHRRIRDQLLIDIGENPSFSFQDETNHTASELKSEFEDLKNQIGEAKLRLEADDAIAAAKAASKAALLAENKANCDDNGCPVFKEHSSEAIDFSIPNIFTSELEESLIPNTSLLKFEENDNEEKE